jgi:serine/threonine-protein kinase
MLQGSPLTLGRAPVLVAGLCLGSWIFPTSALAQTTAPEKAVAETLFVDGKKLLMEGRYAEGCAKLEQSQAMEAAVGTMLYLAECYEKTQRLASAWAMFREASSRALAEGQADRAQTGAERAKVLEPKLSRLTVNLAPGGQVQGLVIRLDGSVLPLSLLGTAVPVDGGTHTLMAEAPGHQPFSIQLSVADPAGFIAVQVPVLGQSQSAAVPEPEPPPPAPAPAQPVDRGVESGTSDKQPILGLAIAGAGLVGVGVGVYFGLKAADTDDEAERICPRTQPCDDMRGIDLTDDAQTQALVANVLYGVGGAAVIAGAVLYLTADGPSPASGARSLPAFQLGSARNWPDAFFSPSYSGVSLDTEF